jgi:hypothetical protein
MDGKRMAVPAGERTRSDWLKGEPLLEELLGDPVLGTLIRSDGIDAASLRDFLQELRRSARARKQRDRAGAMPSYPRPPARRR